jgi:putative peptide zinc metalloprotease protein
MNLTEALNQVLPEMPAKIVSARFPRLHPDIVAKEHMQDGAPIVKAYVPGVDAIFTLAPENWRFAKLFDGQRSYEDVAALHFQETGTQITAEDIREMAEGLDAMDFWYKTPLEKNVTLMQKSAAERRKALRAKKKTGDLSLIMFPAMNPDRFLDWLHRNASFLYSWWFTWVTIAAFLFMGGIFVTHWSEVSHDTFQFYNFADKTWGDVAAFWILGSVLGCIHELAHGLTCKHYGGRVHSMGFALIYLSPAFYTDTSEGMVTADRHQRLMISVAGVWSELMVCALATPVWWGTAPGTVLHDFAYTVILITGFGVILINWNPLIKLDGYYMLSEVLGIADLKEASTIYVSSWVKKHIWRLPVEVPYIPKRRRLGFAVYAILSGIYSYLVLYVLAGFVGNAFRNFDPAWSFIPEVLTAGLIFRSRIRTLVNFMKFVYLDKKDRVRAWFTLPRSLAAVTAVLLVLLLPLWHTTAEGRFVLEPISRAEVRTMVPGIVTAIYANEGEPVIAGQPLVHLQNLDVESKLARSQAAFQEASARLTSASLRNQDLGASSQDRERLGKQTGELRLTSANLDLKSPISGTVLTGRLNDRLGSYLTGGTQILEVADLAKLRARFYLSEPDMYKFRSGLRADLQVDGTFRILKADTVGVAPLATQIEPGLIDLTKYEGLKPPKFYVANLEVDNASGELRPGMVGTARVYGKRRSLGGLAMENLINFVGRRIW